MKESCSVSWVLQNETIELFLQTCAILQGKRRMTLKAISNSQGLPLQFQKWRPLPQFQQVRWVPSKAWEWDDLKPWEHSSP